MKVEVVRHCAMIPVLRYVTTTGGETLVPSRPEVELTMDDLIGQPARMTGRELANQRASLQAVFELHPAYVLRIVCSTTACWFWLIVHGVRETFFF